MSIVLNIFDFRCKCGHCKVVSYHMRKYDRICCRELSRVAEFLHEEVEGEGDWVSDSDSEDHHINCITSHPQFQSDVLEYGALFRSQQIHPDLDLRHKIRNGKYGKERAHNSTWAFVSWIWDRMGYDTKIMPPACVVSKIREEHMKSTPFWYYRNFIPSKKVCEYGRHCVEARKDAFRT
jgi:hypothetical protein